MMKTSGTVYVLDLDDIMHVKQAVQAAKGYAKERLGEERAEHEKFENAPSARYFLSMIEAFEKKILEQ